MEQKIFHDFHFSDFWDDNEYSLNFDKVLRNLFTEITNEKGYFGLHGDDASHLAYDIQFYLLSINKTIKTRDEFAKEYPPMVAMGNKEISTGGYTDFFLDWFDSKMKSKHITKKLFGGLTFTGEYKRHLFDQIKKYE